MENSGIKRIEPNLWLISVFRQGVREILAVLGFYEALIGSLSPTFWDNLSLPSSRVQQIKKIGCPESL
jgi:hypothetical protein